MKLAMIVYKDAEPWGLRDRGRINPPIGTIVQYEHDGERVEVYFPGCVVGGSIFPRICRVMYSTYTLGC